MSVWNAAECMGKLATHQLGLSMVALRCVNASKPYLPVVYPAAMPVSGQRQRHEQHSGGNLHPLGPIPPNGRWSTAMKAVQAGLAGARRVCAVWATHRRGG